MTLTVAAGQRLMERGRLRTAADFTPAATEWKKETLRWLFLLSTILVVAAVPVYTSNLYFIPAAADSHLRRIAGSKAGFRNRPVQIFPAADGRRFPGHAVPVGRARPYAMARMGGSARGLHQPVPAVRTHRQIFRSGRSGRADPDDRAAGRPTATLRDRRRRSPVYRRGNAAVPAMLPVAAGSVDRFAWFRFRCGNT